ncbi:hypothetical protein ADUPG1_005835, partial [Aduncisulcus paluster]
GHPGIVEVAVVGVPDDDLGQRIVAYVVGDVTEDDVIGFVAQQLSVHKRPRSQKGVDQVNVTEEVVDQINWHWTSQLRPRFDGLT